MEIELKLLVAPRHLRRVFEADPVQRRARGEVRRGRLVSVYLDTPDARLRKNGVALRLRREDGRWVQTLKGGGRVEGGLHRRGEWDWPLAGRQPDLSRMEHSEFGALFRRRSLARSLQEVFTTRFERSSQTLRFDDGSILDLCTDRGAIVAGERRAAISEIEIELKNGDRRRLFELARELLAEIPFRLGARSKAERGYALGLAEEARPRKAQPVTLEAHAPAGAAFSQIVSACLAQIHANEDGFLESAADAEYLHQLRVGMRRLRVALALPRDAAWREAIGPIRDELRWLAGSLGPARNWDVFVAETLTPLSRQSGEVRGLADWMRRCAGLRGSSLDAAQQAVRSPRYTRLMLSVGELLSCGEALPGAPESREFAKAALRRHDRRVRDIGGTLASAGAAERHRARIEAKKLRYCAEFFASLYPGRAVRHYVGALEALQDLLGALNDAAAAAAMTTEAAAAGRRADARVVGMVQGWIAAGEARALAQLPRAWKRFAEQQSFWE